MTSLEKLAIQVKVLEEQIKLLAALIEDKFIEDRISKKNKNEEER